MIFSPNANKTFQKDSKLVWILKKLCDIVVLHKAERRNLWEIKDQTETDS